MHSVLRWEFGGDLLSHGRTTLSSALSRFTVLFGMGRGGAKTLWPPNEEGSVVRLGMLPGLESSKWLCILGLIDSSSFSNHDVRDYRIKPHGQLVSVSLTHYCASTPDLSTSWSRTNLQRDQVPREVSS